MGTPADADLGPTDGSYDTSQGPRFLEGPTISKNPNTAVPLAAVVKFKADVPVDARLEIESGMVTRTVAFHQTDTDHSLPVLGLEPQTTYTVKVMISNKEGTEVTAPDNLTFVTDPLPGNFPPLTVTATQAGSTEPGVFLLAPYQVKSGTDRLYLLAVNEAGKVVWFYRPDWGVGISRALSLRPLDSGNLLYLPGGGKAIVEIDMLGNVVQQWHASGQTSGGPAGSVPVKTAAFHHDVLELPSGNLLALSKEVRLFTSYPTSDTDPSAPKAPGQVVGDVVLEFQRNGTIVNQWRLLDMLDPFRFGYGGIGGGGKDNDWSHANGLAYDPGDDAILVSVRHQDVVVKFSRKTGKLLWLLGPHANWKPPWNADLLAPQGGLAWPYHTHCPVITPNGNLLLFDNGNERASPFDSPLDPSKRYSRAVEFSIDEGKKQVTEVWAYGGPGDELFYSKAQSGVQWLPKTGNVLVTDGRRITDSAGNPSQGPVGQHWARIVEVTHTKPATKVFELVVKEDGTQWTVYRSYKVPSLYPSTLAHEN